MTTKRFLISYCCAVVISFSLLLTLANHQAEAEEKVESFVKEKTIGIQFNDQNPEGNVDLEKIANEELDTPSECEGSFVICQIEEIAFDITLRKKWKRYDVRELSNYEFANTVPEIKSPVGKLTQTEIVILQETLARRGLLTYLDGGAVHDRGFEGHLTKLAEIKLAHIKGLNPGDPAYDQQLTDQINELIRKMAKDDQYVQKNPLPQESEMIPEKGDPLFDEWNDQLYKAKLASSAQKVITDPGSLPDKSDFKVDGYLNVEKVGN